MKKLTLSLLSLALMTGFSGNTMAKAEVEVNWLNPDDYTDVRAANESRSRFKERTFKDLEEYFNKLAEDLPDDQKLVVNVTNLDLAGQVWPGSFVGLSTGSDVRLIKRVDIPRMTFNYKLMGKDGNELRAEQVELKDMSFQDRVNPLFDSESLRYEKNMIRQWFEDSFSAQLAKASN
ncbi:DUF3016 domain-containing protein [Bowmanella dokdonensis]|uniref:DUF3016 domain-containing protein n=1 Tax=Bowmanella dokdonensis TaxID=751969 RepID=A0A939DPQ9_9ALTE|nr:DUF3016 domain-containing protein [Bowmanella dokdonensis]MBN7826107.1 DUF3016 domain-containing protein [Bowmanella dokdonensis]